MCNNTNVYHSGDSMLNNPQMKSLCNSMLKELGIKDLGHDHNLQISDTPTSSDSAHFPRSTLHESHITDLVANTKPPNTLLGSSWVSLSIDLETSLRECNDNLKSTRTFASNLELCEYTIPVDTSDTSKSRRKHADAELRYDAKVEPRIIKLLKFKIFINVYFIFKIIIIYKLM